MTQDDASDVGMKMSPGLMAYLGVLGLVGVGLMVAGNHYGWGFWGWFGGALLILAGWGSLLANHFKVGWQPAVGPCPSCGHRLHFLTKKQHLRCVGCQAFLRVEGQKLVKLDGDSMSRTPKYPVPYVSAVSFPPTCMLCGQPATQTQTVRWDKYDSKADFVVVSVIEVTKLSLEVPICAQHSGLKAVEFDYGDHPSTQHDGVSIKFRSLSALEAFRQHNAAVMPPIRNEPQMPHAPTAD